MSVRPLPMTNMTNDPNMTKDLEYGKKTSMAKKDEYRVSQPYYRF